MVESKVLIIYFMFLVFFNLFAGYFLSEQEDSTFDIQSWMIIQNTREALSTSDSLFASILKIVLVPFLLIDFVVFIFVLMSISFTSLPPLLNLIIFTPMSIIIIADYVYPAIRGN